MQKIVFSIFLSYWALSLNAHNAQISTISLVQNEGHIWSLHLSSSFDGFRYQLLYNYPEIKVNDLSADEFQKLLLQHLEDNIVIHTNGNEIGKLENGMIKLGHQTDLKFEVAGLPDSLISCSIKLIGLSENSKHNSIFKIITPGTESKNFVLKRDNGFTISIDKIDNQYQVASKDSDIFWVYIAFAFTSILLLFVIARMLKSGTIEFSTA